MKPVGLKKIAMLTLAALLVASAPEALAQKGGGSKKKDDTTDSKPAPPRPEFTTGIVATYTPENRTLKLNTGGEYKLSAAAGNTLYKQGDKVQIRWVMKGGTRIADQVIENLAIERPNPTTTPASTPTSPAPAAAPAAPSNPS